MNNNKITTILLGAILLISIGVLIVSLQPKVIPNVTVNPAFSGENEFYDGVTAAVVSVSATSTNGAITQILAASSGRQYARFQNTGVYTASCQLDDATSTLAVGTGIVLYASTSYEIRPDNLYKGIVRCIASTATTTISVVQK